MAGVGVVMSKDVPEEKRAEVAKLYNQLSAETDALRQQLTKLEGDHEEHAVVIEALEKLNGDRKCFRLINGVLIEKTVGEILPDMKVVDDNLQARMKELLDVFRRKNKELDQVIEKNGIKPMQ